MNDQSKRNENWIWFVDKSTGKGAWAINSNKMDLKDGQLTFFYSSGEIYCTGQIKNSVYIDTARFYDKSGKCIKAIIYDGNGTDKNYYPLEGKYFGYYNTGEVETESFVVNHKLTGFRKLYLKNGNISYQDNMINDKGWSSDFYESGSMKDSFYLANGKQEGTYKEWYENGRLSEISNWKNSLQEGKSILYYENGNLKNVRIFENGQEEGLAQNYHDNGKVQMEFTYIHGSREGELKQYYKNGKPKCVGQFEDDKEVGEWLWYDEKGKLFQQDTYKEGQLIAVKKL